MGSAPPTRSPRPRPPPAGRIWSPPPRPGDTPPTSSTRRGPSRTRSAPVPGAPHPIPVWARPCAGPPADPRWAGAGAHLPSRGTCHGPAPSLRLYADRAAGRDRHHRHPHRPPAARGPEGPRGRQPHEVLEQPQADRPGRAQLPRHAPEFPFGKGPTYRGPGGPGVRPVVGPQPDAAVHRAGQPVPEHRLQLPAGDPGHGRAWSTSCRLPEPGRGQRRPPAGPRCRSSSARPTGPPLPGDWPGQNNYYANQGTSFLCDVSESQPSTIAPNEQSTGRSTTSARTRMATITDGLSNTVLFSEKLRGTGHPEPADRHVHHANQSHGRPPRTPPATGSTRRRPPR